MDAAKDAARVVMAAARAAVAIVEAVADGDAMAVTVAARAAPKDARRAEAKVAATAGQKRVAKPVLMRAARPAPCGIHVNRANPANPVNRARHATTAKAAITTAAHGKKVMWPARRSKTSSTPFPRLIRRRRAAAAVEAAAEVMAVAMARAVLRTVARPSSNRLDWDLLLRDPCQPPSTAAMVRLPTVTCPTPARTPVAQKALSVANGVKGVSAEAAAAVVADVIVNVAKAVTVLPRTPKPSPRCVPLVMGATMW